MDLSTEVNSFNDRILHAFWTLAFAKRSWHRYVESVAISKEQQANIDIHMYTLKMLSESVDKASDHLYELQREVSERLQDIQFMVAADEMLNPGVYLSSEDKADK